MSQEQQSNSTDEQTQQKADQQKATQAAPAQRAAYADSARPEDEDLAQLKQKADRSNAVTNLQALQRKANESGRVYQLKSTAAALNEATTKDDGPVQRAENNTGLPDNLKSGIESLSGYSMDDVKVHRNSDKPAQLQAHAYAQGTDIHLGPGQEKHLPHEAWHVVQQKQGRVKPTKQLKSKVNVNDDAGLEKEADVMGAKAAIQFNHEHENDETKQFKLTENAILQFTVEARVSGGYTPDDAAQDKLKDQEGVRKFRQMTFGDVKKIILDEKTNKFLKDQGLATYNLLSQSAPLVGAAGVDQLIELFCQGIYKQLQSLGDVWAADKIIEKAEQEKDPELKAKVEKIRKVVKDYNPPFSELAKTYASLLNIDSGETLALWSGGKALSDYAFQVRKYRTLESTTLGQILDGKNPTGGDNFKYMLAPLWNQISKRFCDQNVTGPVHVMLRAFEGDSVLHLQEIPQIRKQGLDINFHPIWGVGDHLETFREAKAGGNVYNSPTEGAGFKTEGEAQKVLYDCFVLVATNIASAKIKEWPLNDQWYEPLEHHLEAYKQSEKYGSSKIKENLKKVDKKFLLTHFNEDDMIIELWLKHAGTPEDHQAWKEGTFRQNP